MWGTRIVTSREHTLERDTYNYGILLLQVAVSGIFTFVQVVRMLDFHSRDTGSSPVRENQFARVVKGEDLRSFGRRTAWVRIP